LLQRCKLSLQKMQTFCFKWCEVLLQKTRNFCINFENNCFKYSKLIIKDAKISLQRCKLSASKDAKPYFSQNVQKPKPKLTKS
jgi:hypothetical protein